MSRLGIAPAAIAVLFLPGMAAAADLIVDGRFEQGRDTFWAGEGVALTRSGRQLCADVSAGGDTWDRLIGVNGLKLEPGLHYRLSLSTAADPARAVSARIQRGAEPWTVQSEFSIAGAPERAPFSADFMASEEDEAQLIFPLGGAEKSWRFCIDDLSLVEIEASAGAASRANQGPAIRVNQLGYFTDGPKRATVISDARRAISFQLIDAGDAVVGEGTTRPSGFDPSAGVRTHVADFSAYAVPGNGYRLVSGDWTSDRFSISDDLYGRLRVDALSWFYPQRSGIQIRGDIAGKAYARPAGHIGVAPNEGDQSSRLLDWRRGQGALWRLVLLLSSRRFRRLVRCRRSRQIRGQRCGLGRAAAGDIRARPCLWRCCLARPRRSAFAHSRKRQRHSRSARRGAMGAAVPACNDGAGR